MRKNGMCFKKICLSSVLAAVCGLVASCINDEQPAGGAELRVGDVQPVFRVVLSDSTLYDSSVRDGRVVVLTFFNTSCNDCRRELPVLQRVCDAYREDGAVRFVCISREEDETSIAAFWRQNSLTLPYSAQTDRRIYNLFASSAIPRTYIIDKKGILRFIYTDDPLATEAQLLAAVRTLRTDE